VQKSLSVVQQSPKGNNLLQMMKKTPECSVLHNKKAVAGKQQQQKS